jgi:chromosomal replication initiation ATPase DnaA
MTAQNNVVFLKNNDQIWSEAKSKLKKIVGEKNFEAFLGNLRLDKYQPNEHALLTVATDSLKRQLCKSFIGYIAQSLDLEKNQVFIKTRSIFRAPQIKEPQILRYIDPKIEKNRKILRKREKLRLVQQGLVIQDKVSTDSPKKEKNQTISNADYRPKTISKIDIESVVQEVEKYYGVNRSAILRPSKSISDELARDMAIHLSYTMAKAGMEELTNFFICSKKKITAAQKRVAKRTSKLAGYNDTLKDLRKKIVVRVYGNISIVM